MISTSLSLLERLQTEPDDPTWDRFVRFYTPIMAVWATRLGLQDSDRQDLVQDVFTQLLNKIPQYRRDDTARFRDWLRSILTNRHRELLRRKRPVSSDVEAVADSTHSDADFWEREFQTLVTARALQFVQSEFNDSAWRCFWETTVLGRSAVDVGQDVGLSQGAVYVAKSRVLARLRKEFADILD